jgi:hypothetical protein
MTSPNERLSRRHRVLDLILIALDVVIGGVAVVSGIVAFIAPPPSIIREVSLPWLIVVWGVFLIAGGVGASAGRISGIWIFETTGIVSIGVGVAIYLVVVLTAAQRELGVLVACGIILIAALELARRYVELQKFLAEPGDVSLLERLQNAWRTRTITYR